MLPLFIRNRAGPWLGLSVCVERMTQTSSMQRARFGSNSLTSTPLRPCLANRNGTAIRPPVAFSVRSCTAADRWPANRLIDGLGSRRSGPNGPPFMNRWMTRLARGRNCGAWLAVARARAEGARRLARPRAPKPPPRARIMSRRVIGSMVRLLSIDPIGSMGPIEPMLIDIQKLVRGQQHLRILLPRRIAPHSEELDRQAHLSRGGRPAVQQQVRPPHPLLRTTGRLSLQPAHQRRRLRLHERAVQHEQP